jgi:hypothetical protein
VNVTEPEHLPDTPHEQVAPGGQLEAQSEQTSPAAPHAAVDEPDWQLVPSQQAPLQTRSPTQLALQRPVATWQASPFGQLAVVHMGASRPEASLASGLESLRDS